MIALVLFLLVAFGLSWLIVLPLWIGGVPLSSPLITVFGAAMMLSPSAGVLAVRAARRRRGDLPDERGHWRRATGVGLGVDPRRTLVVSALTWVGVPLLVLLALAVSAAVGVLSLDLAHFSLYRESLAAAGARLPMDVGVLVALQLVAALVLAPALNALFAFGEEWGWRGWLLPELVGRVGRWPALFLTGAIWAGWHAPLTLRGYNYPNLGPWAMPYFLGFCLVFGVAVGWLRLATGSVWPAVIAHGALNGSAGLVTVLGDAADPPNLVLAGITGLVGWVLLAGVCVALPRLLPIREAPAPVLSRE